MILGSMHMISCHYSHSGVQWVGICLDDQYEYPGFAKWGELERVLYDDSMLSHEMVLTLGNFYEYFPCGAMSRCILSSVYCVVPCYSSERWNPSFKTRNAIKPAHMEDMATPSSTSPSAEGRNYVIRKLCRAVIALNTLSLYLALLFPLYWARYKPILPSS